MDICDYYKLALEEGQGLGTAYEYFVKNRFLKRTVKGKINNSLIMGLPERYGLSADLFIFLDKIGSRIDFFERDDKKALQIRNILFKRHITANRINWLVGHYDLILSCEYMHLDYNQSYWDYITQNSKQAIIFLPNGDNASHQKISGLRGMSMKTLIESTGCRRINPLDMPPFPPGITSNNRFRTMLCIPLELYSYIENILPYELRKRYSHIYALDFKKEDL